MNELDAAPAGAARLRAGENLTGRTIAGRYRLQTLLGVGSMGIVYGACRLVDSRVVAIKVLRSHLAADTEAGQRFQAEATAASAIGNKHVVEVLDYGRLQDGTAFLVMEHLQGASLASLIDGEPMPLRRLLSLAQQVAAALGAAHRSGIVHRDLKPENVLVCQDEQGKDFVKIVDFGIAKFAMGQPWLTQVGAIFGTPAYMSPEQALGEEVDHRTDVYALGVMLYEMACGALPFDADNARAILVMQATEKPLRLSRRFVGVSRELEAVVHKCLSKERSSRYESMAELAADLTRIAAGMPVRAPAAVSSPEMGVEERELHDRPTMPAASPKRAARGPRWLALGAAVAVAVAVAAACALAPARGKALLLGRSEAVAAGARAGAANVVTLVVLPGDARVLVDGADQGSSPVAVSVPTGRSMTVRIARSGYLPRELTLDGSETRVAVRLLQAAQH